MIAVDCPRCRHLAASAAGTPTPCDTCMVEIEFRLRSISTRSEREELWLPEEEEVDEETDEEPEADEAGAVPTVPILHVDRSPREGRDCLQGVRLDWEGVMTEHEEGVHVSHR